MKRTISFILAFILICSINTIVFANKAETIITRTAGVVVDIIDTDAFVVKLNNSGKTAYVRLIGVKGNAENDGRDYLLSNVLGKNVILEPDYSSSVTLSEGRWNLLYVYLVGDGSNINLNIDGKELLNETMVKKGYAKVDDSYTSISKYSALAKEQQAAKSSKIGIWNEGKDGSGYFYTGNMVNINTASITKLKELLDDVPTSVISALVEYRRYNPFRNIYDLKYVDGMTKDIFDDNRNMITVVTNINRASEKELNTLISSNTKNIDLILDFRARERFTLLTELHTKAGLNRQFYDDNKPFISLRDEEEVTYTIPEVIVNINTASLEQLEEAIKLSSQSTKIISGRQKGYGYKTIMELLQIRGFDVSERNIHRYTDNLHVVTDINSATKEELRSLFGSQPASHLVDKLTNNRPFNRMSDVSDAVGSANFDKFKDYISLGKYSIPERVNLNTATEAQMVAVGISRDDARSLYNKRGTLTTSGELPINVQKFQAKVSLYTDINTATVAELRSLNAFTDPLINAIISYRNDQPFGSKQEMQEFFEYYGTKNSYDSVSKYLVVR